jgi:hypothetical protein
MAKLAGGRPEFRQWVDQQPDPGWSLLPLTHISKGLSAEDIVRAGQVGVTHCEVFKEPLAYFFYGRPAYRISGDGAIKVEAACPYCFIFDSGLIRNCKAILAFDTGAFDKRLYKHVMLDEMKIEDFSLEQDERRPNRVIGAVFSSLKAYFDGDTARMVAKDKLTRSWDFLARAYLDLLASPGRNEPDDRICSIEVVFGVNVPLIGNLKAVIVPHTLWDTSAKAPWLDSLFKMGVEIEPYLFVPNRHPEHYHAQLEAAVRKLYVSWGLDVA